jgi:hypothetical protein
MPLRQPRRAVGTSQFPCLLDTILASEQSSEGFLDISSRVFDVRGGANELNGLAHVDLHVVQGCPVSPPPSNVAERGREIGEV